MKAVLSNIQSIQKDISKRDENNFKLQLQNIWAAKERSNQVTVTRARRQSERASSPFY